MLSLLLVVMAQMGCDPDGPIFSCPSSMSTPPAFAFATSSGAGMGTACACAAVTGTKGETLTFTRASSGTCLKASTTTGIANGDMATCTNNQPRAMPGGDGSGGSGLLSEVASTNLILRSQELENAAWSDFVSGVAAPTITANAATAPDNTLTAERFQIPATGAAEASGRFNALPVGVAGASVCSIWVRGNGTSGTVDLVKYNSGAATTDIVACPYTSTGWTWCKAPYTNVTATAFSCYYGNLGAFTGIARGAQDVFFWGVQGEQSDSATSYIATAGAAATRALDNGYFAASAMPNGSMAATLVRTSSSTSSSGEITWTGVSIGASYDRLMMFVASATSGRLYGASGSVSIVATGPLANVPIRMSADWTSTAANLYFASLTNAGALNVPGADTRFYIGNYNDVNGNANGVIKNVCLDPLPTRCR